MITSLQCGIMRAGFRKPLLNMRALTMPPTPSSALTDCASFRSILICVRPIYHVVLAHESLTHANDDQGTRMSYRYVSTEANFVTW